MPEEIHTQFNLVVVTPDAILFEGPVTRLMAPGITQELAILPYHTPLYTQLKSGNLILYPTGSSPKTIQIDGGILRIKQNQASVVVGFEVIGNLT